MHKNWCLLDGTKLSKGTRSTTQSNGVSCLWAYWEKKAEAEAEAKPHFFMAKIIGKSRRRRTTTTQQLCHRMVHHVNVHCNLFHRVSFLGRFIWDRMLLCSLGRPSYLRLPLRDPPPQATVHGGASMHGYPFTTTTPSPCDSDSDLVNLKISLLGDCHIGKTSFVVLVLCFHLISS